MKIRLLSPIIRSTQVIQVITVALIVQPIFAPVTRVETIPIYENTTLEPRKELSQFPRLQHGWPQSTGDAVDSSPVLGDLDGDGDLEILIGSNDAKLYAWNPDGTYVKGWPVKTEYYIRDTPAMGDIDGDGDIEVIVGSMDGHVYAWHHTGTLVDGWPIEFFKKDFTNLSREISRGRTSSPVLGDIDNDGLREIVIGTYDGPVYIWNGDGTRVAGWPQTAGDGAMSSPALGDIDNDGSVEIVCGSFSGTVYVWKPDGQLAPGWPQQTEYIYDAERTSSPALGDLDGDGDLEIVIGSHVGGVYAFHHDGTLVTGWPQSAKDGTHSSPAIGDLDEDGKLEIVIGSKDYNVYAWHSNGTLVAGWPQPTQNINEAANVTLPGVISAPALSDIDGDGDIEIIVGSSDFGIYAWHHTGVLVSGWPIFTDGPVNSSPALNDIDKDSHIEIIVGSWDGKVYVWEVEGAFNFRKTPWSMFRANPFHTGTFQDFDGDGLRDAVELDKYHTDPFIADTGADTDKDGLPNIVEVDIYETDPLTADTDGDGIQDWDEIVTYGTNPTSADSDRDGLSDNYELAKGFNPTNSSEGQFDEDADLLTNQEESELGTDALASDTDKDQLQDWDEVKQYGTNPLDPDSDNDTLSDFEEITIFGSNPNQQDSDNDGISDGDEVKQYMTNPISADTDGDGIIDGDEVNVYVTDPKRADRGKDTDGDGLPNIMEVDTYNTNLTDPDTDKDELTDGDEVEIYQSDPTVSDTDKDGITDGEEVKMGSNPLVSEVMPEFQPGKLILVGGIVVLFLCGIKWDKKFKTK